jgi:hypothetical protein
MLSKTGEVVVIAEPTFYDLDDDGEISIFAKGSQFLFTCSKGHWWTVTASSVGRPEPELGRSIGAAKGSGGGLDSSEPDSETGERVAASDTDLGEESENSYDYSASLRALAAEYGPAPLRAMNMDSLAE